MLLIIVKEFCNKNLWKIRQCGENAVTIISFTLVKRISFPFSLSPKFNFSETEITWMMTDLPIISVLFFGMQDVRTCL